MRGRRHLATLLAAGLAALWGASLALPHWRGEILLLDRLEAPLADLRFLLQGERSASDLVTIVAIDDETVRKAGAYPLPRATLARLVDSIAAFRPKVIALDLLLADPGPADGDRLLAEALRRTPTVLAAAGVFESGVQSVAGEDRHGVAGVPVADRLLLPLRSFAEAAPVGTVNVATDRAGTPRHVPLLLRSGDQLALSLPLQTAALATGEDPVLEPSEIVLGSRKIRTDLGYALPVRFYGPRGTVRTISAGQVLEGGLAAEAVRGRIVVIGAAVTGGGDVFPTPFDSVLPGVEVLATATAHLVSGDGLLRDWRVRAVDLAVAVSLPVLLVLLVAWHRSAVAFSLIAGLGVLWVGLTAAAFMNGVWLNATIPSPPPSRRLCSSERCGSGSTDPAPIRSQWRAACYVVFSRRAWPSGLRATRIS